MKENNLQKWNYSSQKKYIISK